MNGMIGVSGCHADALNAHGQQNQLEYRHAYDRQNGGADERCFWIPANGQTPKPRAEATRLAWPTLRSCHPVPNLHAARQVGKFRIVGASHIVALKVCLPLLFEP
jgi:hypothetical protein